MVWWDAIEEEWRLAHEEDETVETNAPPSALESLVRRQFGAEDPGFIRRVTIEGKLALFFADGDLVRLIRPLEESIEVRFLGDLRGGIYAERGRPAAASEREHVLVYEHERLPGGALEASDVPLKAWNSTFAQAAHARTEQIRRLLRSLAEDRPS